MRTGLSALELLHVGQFIKLGDTDIHIVSDEEHVRVDPLHPRPSERKIVCVSSSDPKQVGKSQFLRAETIVFAIEMMRLEEVKQSNGNQVAAAHDPANTINAAMRLDLYTSMATLHRLGSRLPIGTNADDAATGTIRRSEVDALGRIVAAVTEPSPLDIPRHLAPMNVLGELYELMKGAGVPDAVPLRRGLEWLIVEARQQKAHAYELANRTFVPPAGMTNPPKLVAGLLGATLESAAERLAIEVNSLETRIATLLKMPDREVPFVAWSSAPAVVKALHGEPCSVAALTLAREVKRLHHTQKATTRRATTSPTGFAAKIEAFCNDIGKAASIASFGIMSAFRPPTNKQPTPATPAFEVPTTLADTVHVLVKWHSALNEEIVEAHAAIAAGDEERVENTRYLEGKAHAYVHAMDLIIAVGVRGLKLTPQ